MAINRDDLGKRVAVGAVYVAITSIATLACWQTCALVIAAEASLCCYELLRMSKNNGHSPYILIGTVAAFLIPLGCCLTYSLEHAIAGGLTVAFIAGIIILLRFFASEDDTIVDVALTLFGFLYTGLVMSSFVLLRMHFEGLEGGLICFMTLASIWANDGLAYLGGSAFGRHRFAPRISPKKTWEGVLCGLVGSVLMWLLVPVLVPSCGFGFVWAAVIGIASGIAGIIGDLTESHIKRGFSVKDSGDIMPGHGGMLDRCDSLIFAGCASYAMVVVVPYISIATGGFVL